MSPILSSILISRTDAIGDVVLTLPIARVLKQRFPHAMIGFLAKPYTHPVLEACADVDEIVALEDFLHKPPTRAWDAIIHVFPERQIAERAKQLKIPQRIGTTNRLHHWWRCNRLVPLSRKRSDLHEAQLNLKLLQPLGITDDISLEALSAQSLLTPQAPLPNWLRPMLRNDSPNIILHATSMGSAREWGLENFSALAEKLQEAGHSVFITGTEKDKAVLQPMLAALGGKVQDLSGKLPLPELIAFIAACDGLVAGSTGPLHIAAALGIVAVGLYPAERPMHPGRWAPIGPHASYLVSDPLPQDESVGLPGISVDTVFQQLQRALAKRGSRHSRMV